MARGLDQEALDLWERRESVALSFVPFVTLAVSLLLTLMTGSLSENTTYTVVGLSVVAGLWVLWLVTLHPEWTQRRRLMGLYYAGLLFFMFQLVFLAPWFGLFAFTGYLHAVAVLRGRWRVGGILATALVTATSQNGGWPKGGLSAMVGFAVIVGFNLVLAGMMLWFGWVTQEQSARRRLANRDLAEANRRLAATLEENRGLHALLLTQAREAGVLDERQRLAQEIHDTLAQGLIGIITQLQAADQARGRTSSGAAADGEERRHLDAAARLARESLSEARRSVQALQPEPLEQTAGLPEALAQVTNQWAALNAVAAEVSTTGTARPLHPEVEATVLRTAQEALANVAKHARATRVGLTLSYMEDQITLDVRDDGVGSDPAALAGREDGKRGGPESRLDGGQERGGFGLTAMRQRVDRLAGNLEIESEPGGGTAISASLPAIGAASTVGAIGTRGLAGGASAAGAADPAGPVAAAGEAGSASEAGVASAVGSAGEIRPVGLTGPVGLVNTVGSRR